MLVLRPADCDETVVAWKMALEEKRPVALVLSRQNIKNLPALSGQSRRQEAMQAEKGGYVVLESKDAKVTMIATGSEVSTLVEGAELLAAEGIATRVVSIPSEGLFRDQSKEYQEAVLGNLPRYGMTSGLSVNLAGLVGENGFIHGFDHFGYSAPFKVLDEKFGYNGKAVAEEVKAMLRR